MRYLIDGYNLLHALFGPPASPQGLEPARQRLLDRLCEFPQVEPHDLTVVFDATRAPPNSPVRVVYRGMQLHFPRTQTADDFIEDLIHNERHPQKLVVVSNDHRIQLAAKRRPCSMLECLDWVEQMNRPRAAERAEERPEKPETETETEHWLKTFGGNEGVDPDDFGRLR